MFSASKVASVRKGKVQNMAPMALPYIGVWSLNSRGNRNRACRTPTEMQLQTNVVGMKSRGDGKSSEIPRELKTHFNVMLRLLRLQHQKRIRHTAIYFESRSHHNEKSSIGVDECDFVRTCEMGVIFVPVQLSGFDVCFKIQLRRLRRR